jgi:hypothetical protein
MASSSTGVAPLPIKRVSAPDEVLAVDAVEGGTLNTSKTKQWSFGIALQTAFNQSIMGYDNQFVIGTSYDLGNAGYSADTELGALTEDRGVDGAGILVDESRVRLDTKTHSIGLFFSHSPLHIINWDQYHKIQIHCYHHLK